MKILYDLVTVIEEKNATAQPRSHWVKPGRRHFSMIHQPGNLPAIGTGIENYPDHEELVVPKATALRGLICFCVFRAFLYGGSFFVGKSGCIALPGSIGRACFLYLAFADVL